LKSSWAKPSVLKKLSKKKKAFLNLKKKLENEVAPLGGVGKWELALEW